MGDQLFFIEQNKDAQETIIFLHGVFSSSTEFAAAARSISNAYHLLILDFPGHSNSKHIPLTNLPNLVALVSEFIASHAYGGKAHLVGLSFGAYISLSVAAAHPEQILSVFATGASTSFKGMFGAAIPYLAYGLLTPIHFIPGLMSRIASIDGLVLDAEFLAEMSRNTTWANSKHAYGMLTGEYKLAPVTPRTLFIAGSKGDPLDTLGDAEKILKEGNEESKVVIAMGMPHGWDCKAPDVFGKAVEAWIKRETLPTEIVAFSEWSR